MPNPGLRNYSVMMADNGSGNSAKSVNNNVSTGYTTSRSVGSGAGRSYEDLLRSISAQNNAFNLAQVEAVNSFNAKEAQKNRDWQERMSNTAHQREVQDLIAAGLNPVLSAGGQGAITPSGAVASGQKALADNTYGNGMISLMSAAMSAASAERVASIYAAAQMYGHDISKYGHDVNASNQDKYVKALIENNLNTNETSAANNVRSNWFNAIGDAVRSIPWIMMYQKGMSHRGR